MSGYSCPKDELWWVAKYLLKQDSDRNDSKKKGEEHENQIQVNFNQLVSNLSCLRDIIAIMFENRKLTPKEFEHIRHFYSKPITANEELLSIIARKSRDVYECFLTTLKRTKQDHVYQILEPENENVALKSVSDHKDLIRRNFTWLSEHLDCENGIIALLYQEGVLSPREKEEISCVKDCFDRNEKLLDVLSRKSKQAFEKFMSALKDTNQEHVLKRFHQLKGSPPISSTVKLQGKRVRKKLSRDISHEEEAHAESEESILWQPCSVRDISHGRDAHAYSEKSMLWHPHSVQFHVTPLYIPSTPSKPSTPQPETDLTNVHLFPNVEQPDTRDKVQDQKARIIKIHRRFNTLEIRLKTEISIKVSARTQATTVDIKLLKEDILNTAHQSILQELFRAKKELMRKESEKQDELQQYSIEVKLNEALRAELYSVQNELRCQKDANAQNFKNEVETIGLERNQLEDELVAEKEHVVKLTTQFQRKKLSQGKSQEKNHKCILS